MTPNPHTVGQHQTLRQAEELMREHGIRHLPVLHGGSLVGILTHGELRVVEALPGVDAESVKVEEAIEGEPYAVEPDTPVVEVVRHLRDHKLSAAIVVEHEKVQGVFTTEDALTLLAETLGS